MRVVVCMCAYGCVGGGDKMFVCLFVCLLLLLFWGEGLLVPSNGIKKFWLSLT